MRSGGHRPVGLGLGAARTATGAMLLAFPGVLVRALTGGHDSGPALRTLARLVGVRDLALGAATLGALRRSERAAPLLWLGALCDLTDGLLAVGHPATHPQTRKLMAATAWLSTAVGIREALFSRDLASGPEAK